MPEFMAQSTALASSHSVSAAERGDGELEHAALRAWKALHSGSATADRVEPVKMLKVDSYRRYSGHAAKLSGVSVRRE